MMASVRKVALLTSFTAALCGCETLAKPVFLQTGDVELKLDYEDLAAVLKGAVTEEDGLLIPDALRKRSELLDRQLRVLAAVGPTATPRLLPTEEDRIAYWYNARACWALELSLLYEFPKEFSRRQLKGTQFTLDGKQMSLAEIDDILAGFADWRVVTSAPGITLSRARLPIEPFAGETVGEQIPERLNEFIYDRRRFVVDVLGRRILVPPVIWQFRERLIATHEQTYGAQGANLITSLLPYLERGALRRCQDAVGYSAVAADHRPLGAFVVKDWRIGL